MPLGTRAATLIIAGDSAALMVWRAFGASCLSAGVMELFNAVGSLRGLLPRPAVIERNF
jgi:hypothetical protein